MGATALMVPASPLNSVSFRTSASLLAGDVGPTRWKWRRHSRNQRLFPNWNDMSLRWSEHCFQYGRPRGLGVDEAPAKDSCMVFTKLNHLVCLRNGAFRRIRNAKEQITGSITI